MLVLQRHLLQVTWRGASCFTSWKIRVPPHEIVVRLKWDDASEKHAAICKSLWNRWGCYYYWYHQAFTRKIFIDYYHVPDSLLGALTDWKGQAPFSARRQPRPADGESEWPPGLWVTSIKEQRKVWGGRVCAPASADSAAGWQAQRGRAFQAEGSWSAGAKRCWPSTALCCGLRLLGNSPRHRLGQKGPHMVGWGVKFYLLGHFSQLACC